ncbi:molecular chaperone IbpA [Sphingomonas leidyi]|uniref:Hsp20 family protein n=2 Tax=Sphingomonas TaxID=13687 RepID=A0ABU3N9M2_9SPHN|nr:MULTISPECIES: Hsp20 family protein [Sphingomonas]MDT8760569.1 Hsp20 family protein [Sphingomonas psychrotolerans]NIJ63120.1 molecular chaperone IbpA [Sphingomonas leidyi]
MRTNYDFTPFRRSTVGFDRLFDLLENGLTTQITDGYPPFDLVRDGEDRYRINMAVAGFRPDEIDVTAQQNMLVVSGRKQDSDEGRYIHRGIAARDFERRFGLADYVQVKNAELADGMLSIELVREIPEAMKPRKIAIGSGGDNARRIEDASDKEGSKQLEAA